MVGDDAQNHEGHGGSLSTATKPRRLRRTRFPKHVFWDGHDLAVELFPKCPVGTEAFALAQRCTHARLCRPVQRRFSSLSLQSVGMSGTRTTRGIEGSKRQEPLTNWAVAPRSSCDKKPSRGQGTEQDGRKRGRKRECVAGMIQRKKRWITSGSAKVGVDLWGRCRLRAGQRMGVRSQRYSSIRCNSPQSEDNVRHPYHIQSSYIYDSTKNSQTCHLREGVSDCPAERDGRSILREKLKRMRAGLPPNRLRAPT